MSDSPHIIKVDQSNIVDLVIEASTKQPVLVDVWADWCAPCKHLMPVLEKLADEYNGAFILAKLDGDANQELVQQMGVRGFPTCRLFKDKEAIDEFSGAIPEAQVRQFLEQHIGAAGSANPPA